MIPGKISVILPVYTEGGCIYRNLLEACDTFDSFKLDYELIVVDDGSSDNTFEQARKIRSERVKVVRYELNQGKGNALKHGFKFASGELVAFLDGDLDLHPGQIMTFIRYLEKHDADIVIGSKHHPDSLVSYPLNRRFLSQAYSSLIKFLFDLDISDTQVGFKLFRYDVLEKVLPRIVVKKYAFDLELLLYASMCDFKIVESPVKLDYSGLGSFIDPLAVSYMFLDTMAIACRFHILGYYHRN